MNADRLRFLSLFAGIGGLDFGLERAGWECVGQVETDPYCQNILARHWPNVPRRGDIRLLGPDWLASLGRIDAIVGGFPCQDISSAGKGAGLAGHRSGLWREMRRIIALCRPDWVLAENVPALRTRGADTVLADLEAEGYACWPLVVGARHVGAPHRRDRVWIVGRLEYAQSQRGDGPVRGDERETVSEAVRNESGRRSREGRPGAAESGSSRHGDGQAVSVRAGFPRRRRQSGGAHAEESGSPGDGARTGGVALPLCRGREGRTVSPRPRDAGEGTRGAPWAGEWPARPGEPQHDWEPPRTLEFPMGGRAPGISRKLARQRERQALKALGNAVVPQVAEVLGRAIHAQVST